MKYKVSFSWESSYPKEFKMDTIMNIMLSVPLVFHNALSNFSVYLHVEIDAIKVTWFFLLKRDS